jgi:hypothetical protein
MTQQTADLSRALDEMRARLAALEAAPAPQRPAPAGNGQKDLEAAVDLMVANALLRGRHTAGVLHGMFNLSPGLSGR